MKRRILVAIVGALAFVLSGCDLVTGFLYPNKIAGMWYGYEKGDTSEISAQLNIKEAGTFSATFGHNGEETSVSGSYTYTPQRTYPLTDDEYGSIVFLFEGRRNACQYVVTASSLELRNWRDDEGELRTLTLFR